jgi:hypothetical protein
LATGFNANNKMKAKVVIENGLTTIVLSPENKFETDVLENVHSQNERFELQTSVTSKYSYGVRQDYKLETTIRQLS